MWSRTRLWGKVGALTACERPDLETYCACMFGGHWFEPVALGVAGALSLAAMTLAAPLTSSTLVSGLSGQVTGPPVAPSGSTLPSPTPIVLPDAGTLVWQDNWSMLPGEAPLNLPWFGDSDWLTRDGLLVNDGGSGQPSYIGHNAVAGPGPVASAVQRSGNYTYEVQMQASPGDGAFGLAIRLSSVADWRAGYVNGQVFVLGESRFDGVRSFLGFVPAALLLPRSVASAPFSADSEWHTYRFGAHAHHYTFEVDGQSVVEADDDRYDDGISLAVWTDSTPVQIRDIRLYTN